MQNSVSRAIFQIAGSGCGAPRWRRVSTSRWVAPWAIVFLLLTASASPIAAQGTAQSFHWGGIGIPELDSYWEIAVTLDRFTTTFKPGDLRDTIPWAMDENLGLNSLTIGRTHPVWGRRGTIRMYGQLGYTYDQPTEWLQNEFLHYFNDLTYVPADSVPSREEVDAAIGGEINGFVDFHPLPWDLLDLNIPLFGGVGALAGSVFSEAYVQAGFHSQTWKIGGVEVPTVSYLFRAGLYVEGTSAFPNGTLNNSHRTHQGVITIPLDRWWDAPASLPRIRVGVTSSSGIFLRRDLSEPKDELFCSVQFEWMDGDFAVETYNDTCGGKDTGPSYGVRTWFRWRDTFGQLRQGI